MIEKKMVFTFIFVILFFLHMCEPIVGSRNTQVGIPTGFEYVPLSEHTWDDEELRESQWFSDDYLTAHTDKIRVSPSGGGMDIIDQEQSDHAGYGIALHENTWYAQTFQPSMPVLTRVELFLSKTGSLSNDTNLTVIVKSSLYTDDLKNMTINTSLISEEGMWISFDLFFIRILPTYTYSIVCKTSAGDEENHIVWYVQIDDPYPMGEVYMSTNEGVSWSLFHRPPLYKQPDLCFRTYAETNNPPGKPIKPDGVTKGKYEKPYNYSSISLDQDGHELYYLWSWGDGSFSEWLGPYDAFESCVATHTWMIEGSYLVMVKAKDRWGYESEWSDALTVKMEKKAGYPIWMFPLCYRFFLGGSGTILLR